VTRSELAWLDLDGTANARDVGGLPLRDGGTVAPGRLLRADNLQDLSDADVRHLVDVVGLRAVVDLRTGVEVEREGPGPLTGESQVRLAHHSLHPETGGNTDVDAETIAPWHTKHGDDHEPGESPTVRAYMGYLAHRPDSVVGAVRTIAASPGAVLVHCAAGKDRTGVVVALALEAAGAARDAVVADYLATSERIHGIVARLAASPTYRHEVRVEDVQSHVPRPGTMERVLALVDERHGGAVGFLRAHGLEEDELARLAARLRGVAA
jgi:hypothetical protein